MKALLILVLVGVVAFLAYRNHEKDQAVQMLANEQAAKENVRHEDEMQDKVRKAFAEKEAAVREAQILKRERDEARQEVTAANQEIARLTRTTPKPASWFERRLEENSGRLSSTPAPSNSPRRPGAPVAPN